MPEALSTPPKRARLPESPASVMHEPGADSSGRPRAKRACSPTRLPNEFQSDLTAELQVLAKLTELAEHVYVHGLDCEVPHSLLYYPAAAACEARNSPP
mmetsp:Transcript_18353/g.43920  ORF Transcript_18353/g.43920 Transcript_18353/m.43920 type:complete len:99 (-) Transcript_18353:547-843(-)